MKYDPYATVSDIEVMLNTSYRSAQRRLSEMRKALSVSSKHRFRLSEVREYFIG